MPPIVTRTRARRALQRQAQKRLVERFFESHPNVLLDEDARVATLAEVVVSTVGAPELGAAIHDVAHGDGGELARKEKSPKLHSVYSSCGLALNTFAPWRLEPHSLVIGQHSGFDSLAFEVSCPIFSSRAIPPNLDVLLTRGDAVLAIESKLTEYLVGQQKTIFAPRYTEAVKELADPTWRDQYNLVSTNPDVFQYLNVAQLIKHYLGLKQTFPDQPSTLLYLYWEPTDASDHAALLEHRAEIDRFARALDDPAIQFEAMSYANLWGSWGLLSEPNWLPEHIQELAARYAVELGILA
jgi:Restriction Endonuclease associating with ARP